MVGGDQAVGAKFRGDHKGSPLHAVSPAIHYRPQ